MEETFKSLNETFNLSHSNNYDFNGIDDHTEIINVGINNKFKKEKKIKSKPQILEIKNNNTTYYKKETTKSEFDANKYIDDIIEKLLQKQEEYILSNIPKSEYENIRREFKKFLENIDIELKVIEKDKIKEQVFCQKTKLCKEPTKYSQYKEKVPCWTF